MKTFAIIAVLAVIPLTGCVIPSVERERAIGKLEAKCNAEGGRFVVGKIEQNGIPNVTSYDTSVEGECILQADPRYARPNSVEPAAPAPAPSQSL
jgi:hypothetical protein